MERLNIDFTCESPDIDENKLENESIEELVVRLAYEKSAKIGKKYSDALIIGSDQLAICDNQILGKPGNHENAVVQLKSMSGKKIVFYTGLCLFNTRTGKHEKDVVLYNVIFRKLTDSEVENYLRREEPYNCAGSFKSEGLGISLFKEMVGQDPTALIGLPLIRLCEMLRNQNIEIP